MRDAPFTADRLLALYDRVADAEDAIPRLRRFVLDLAVRGKLVEQDPQEVAPKNSPRAVKDGAPYDLPGNWLWVRIGDQLELLNGMAFKPTDWKREGLRIVRIQNLNNESAPFNLCDPREARERSIIDDGSFLISWSGTPGTSFGAFIWNRGRAVLNQHIFRCDFKTEAFLPDYLRLAVNGRLDEMIAKAHGGVGLQHITKGKLESMLIALPPLAEQQRIVAKVDELMALCDRLEAARAERDAVRDRLTAATLSRLTAPETDAETFPTHASFALQTLPTLTTRPDQIKTLRQTILNLAVRGKLVEQDPTDEPAAVELARTDKRKREANLKKPKALPTIVEAEMWCELPPGWEWVRWDRITNWITYGFTRPMPHEKVGVPIVTGKNVNAGRIILDTADRTSPEAFAELNDKDRPVKGDILITKDGSIGRTAIVENDDPFCINQSVAVLWLRSCDASRRYLQMVLDSPQVQQTLLDKTAGVAIKHISIIDLGQMVFPLPPLAEQHRIVAKVDALMALCDQLEASLTTATTTRSRLLEALLHEALDGTGVAA